MKPRRIRMWCGLCCETRDVESPDVACAFCGRRLSFSAPDASVSAAREGDDIREAMAVAVANADPQLCAEAKALVAEAHRRLKRVRRAMALIATKQKQLARNQERYIALEAQLALLSKTTPRSLQQRRERLQELIEQLKKEQEP